MAHILLIDDFDAYRAMLRDFLEESGHTVVEAGDGQEGLNRYSSETFDLVITDIIMPKKEGAETIIELRRMDAGARIIAISGGGKMVLAHTCLQIARSLNVKEVLEKPFPMEHLTACIAAMLA